MVVDQVIDKVVEKEVNTVDSKVQIRKETESDQTGHKTNIARGTTDPGY